MEDSLISLVKVLPFLKGIEFKIYVFLLAKEHSTLNEIEKGISSNRKTVSKSISLLLHYGLINSHADTVTRYTAEWVESTHIDRLVSNSYIKNNIIVGANGNKVPIGIENHPSYTWAHNWAVVLLDRITNAVGSPAHINRLGEKELLNLWTSSILLLTSKYNFPETEVEKVLSYLINKDKFWIYKGALRSPAKLSLKRNNGDGELYFEFIQDQMNRNMIYTKTNVDDKYEDPYK